MLPARRPWLRSTHGALNRDDRIDTPPPATNGVVGVFPAQIDHWPGRSGLKTAIAWGVATRGGPGSSVVGETGHGDQPCRPHRQERRLLSLREGAAELVSIATDGSRGERLVEREGARDERDDRLRISREDGIGLGVGIDGGVRSVGVDP